MLIFIDQKAPAVAKQNLAPLGEVVEFATHDICYEAISGHPDIFFFQSPGNLVVAPNTPVQYKEILRQHGVMFQEGEKQVGAIYPNTAHYNALYTEWGILHNYSITDPAISKLNFNKLECRQGYVRCNAIQAGRWLITSDRGIEKAFSVNNKPVLHINSQNVVLKGFRNGFLGGCCGIHQKKIYFCGSLKHLPQAGEMISVLNKEGFEIVELYEGPLIDVGGIFFFQTCIS